MINEAINETQLRRLLEVGRSLVTELDLEALLEQVLETARDLTGARYAALGILDKDKAALERFLDQGVDEETRRGIGPFPKGRGVLGEMIRHPAPLRLESVEKHPRSYGFPPGHPPMKTFLGVPIQIRGEAFGNIYLTEKSEGRPFHEGDEATLVVLADWAAVAIDNARLYEESERRRAELERAVQALETTVSLARVGAAGTDIGSLQKLISNKGRSLVDSRTLLLLGPADRAELLISTVAGEAGQAKAGISLPAGNPVLEAAHRDGQVHQVPDLSIDLTDGGSITAASALVVHLNHRGRSQGYLVAADAVDRADFTADDVLLFQSYAGSAASSLATARDVERDQLRMVIDASEMERRRWAMELHDQTLQDLGALKVMNEVALSHGDAGTMHKSLEIAANQLEETITALESLIHELRPATLDALGLAAAIETLVERTSSRGGITASTHIDLAFEREEADSRLGAQLEATIYRIVQEALNNVIKHAEASKASVAVTEAAQQVTIFVEDDGKGFSPSEGFNERFGLHGMRERVDLVDGWIEIDSSPGKGTRVEVHLPVRRQNLPQTG